MATSLDEHQIAASLAPTEAASTALVVFQTGTPPAAAPTNEELIGSSFDEVRRLLRQTHEDIIEIGERLLELRGLIPHGQWERRLGVELGMSRPTAHRFMDVAKRLGKTFPGNAFEKHALYALAGKNVSADAIEEAGALAKAKAESGLKVTKTEAKSIVENHRSSSPRAGRIRGPRAGSSGAGAAEPVKLNFSGVPQLAASVAGVLTPIAKRLKGHAYMASAIAIAADDGVLAKVEAAA
jgi:hypothetical protein